MLAAGGRLGVAAHAPALRSAACVQHSRLAAPALAPLVTSTPATRLVVCYSSKQSWGDIAAEAVQVAK
jgi:hypothetical protein